MSLRKASYIHRVKPHNWGPGKTHGVALKTKIQVVL